jgi:hypothetical protein
VYATRCADFPRLGGGVELKIQQKGVGVERVENDVRQSNGVERAKADLRRSWREIHKHVKAAGEPLGLSRDQILQITRTVARDAELTVIAEFENDSG